MAEYFGSEAESKWLQERWANFSSSAIHPITIEGKTIKGTTSKEMFGEGAKTLIMTIARQAYTRYNEEDNVETYRMKVGKTKEAESFEYLKKTRGIPQLVHYGGSNPVFKLHSTIKDFGCSPDGVAPLPNDRISFGCEMKCPSGATHFDYLFEIETAEDLKRYEPAYYTQIQSSMMCYDTDLWLWNSYNEYFPLKERMLTIEVPKDNQFCSNLEIRLMQASKLKNKIVEMRMNGHKGKIDFNTL